MRTAIEKKGNEERRSLGPITSIKGLANTTSGDRPGQDDRNVVLSSWPHWQRIPKLPVTRSVPDLNIP